MKGIPKRKGLLVVALIAAMILASGFPAAGTSCAADLTADADPQLLYDVKVRYVDDDDQSLIDDDLVEDQPAGRTVTAGAFEIFGYDFSSGQDPVKSCTVTRDPASNVITFYYTRKADYFTVRVQYIDENEKFINEERNRAYSVASGSAVTEEAIHFDEYTLAEEESPVKSVTVNAPMLITFRYTYNREGRVHEDGNLNNKEVCTTVSDHFAYVVGYPDGEVKPLGTITREEVAAIFFRLMTEDSRKQYYSASQPFTDITAGRWSNDEIATLLNAKIIQGNTDGSFAPSKPITRAEFAAVAARFDTLDEASENMFPDIENHWAKKYINFSAQKGWISGYGDGTFRPDNIILRCEAMKMINEELDRRVNTAGLCSGTKQWPDNTADKWYYEIVLEATNTHDYERENRTRSTEKWTKLKDNPVW